MQTVNGSEKNQRKINHPASERESCTLNSTSMQSPRQNTTYFMFKYT